MIWSLTDVAATVDEYLLQCRYLGPRLPCTVTALIEAAVARTNPIPGDRNL